MDMITKIKTQDGQEFDSVNDAQKHINILIGNKLSPLCHKMANLKWSQLPEFVMNNLDDFQAIISLNADLILPAEEDEEDKGSL